MPASGEQLRYSTPEHLALEQALIERIEASDGRVRAWRTRDDVRRAIAARPTLSGEQQRLVEPLCLDGDGVAVVAGKAGTGKTFALGAAREAWQAAGHPVLGVAVARRAAGELQDGAGIESTSVAALLGDLGAGRDASRSGACSSSTRPGWSRRASSPSSSTTSSDARGKLVLVGDHRQLPESRPAACFRGLVQRGLAIELSENVRQAHAWEREALDHLRDGRAEEALAPLRRARPPHRRADGRADARAPRRRLARPPAIATERDDRPATRRRRRSQPLARRATARWPADAAGPELELAGGRVRGRRSGRRQAQRPPARRDNGERGGGGRRPREQGSLLLQCGGRQVVLDRDFLRARPSDGEPTLLHGYAITGHVAQGLTVDRAFVLAERGHEPRVGATSRSAAAASSNQLYVAAQPDEARASSRRPRPSQPIRSSASPARLQSSSAQVLAIDTGRSDAEHEQLRILHRLERAAAVAERERRSHRKWEAKLDSRSGRSADVEPVERAADARLELLQTRRAIAEQHARSRAARPRARAGSGAARAAENLRERQAERIIAANADSDGSSDAATIDTATGAGAALHAHAPRGRGLPRNQHQSLRAQGATRAPRSCCLASSS